MVNKSLVLQNRRGVMERKCKLVRQYQLGSSSRPCVATSSTGPVLHPAQPQYQPRSQLARQGFSTPQRQVIQRPNNFQTPTARSKNVQRTPAAQDLMQTKWKCYAYGEKGHLANRCPNPHPHPNQTSTVIPAPTSGANSVPVAAKQNYAHRRVNHVVIVVLFDSGASHSFIFAAYVEKHNLPLPLLKCQMIVSSLGGRYVRKAGEKPSDLFLGLTVMSH
jgi:hypothetical protein